MFRLALYGHEVEQARLAAAAVMVMNHLPSPESRFRHALCGFICFLVSRTLQFAALHFSINSTVQSGSLIHNET
jgi:hypothetical protein